MRSQALKGHLDMLLLSVLADGPKHGYAIVEELRRRSGDVFDLPDGTVYPALHRLDEAGLIEGRWGEAQGRRRRTYTLTRTGREQLGEERRSWREFLTAVDGVIGEGPWPIAT
jgi:transcriptional regulator